MAKLDITIISMLFITALSNSAFALVAPFLPFEFEKKQLDQSLVGYIFSVYSVAIIITSPFIGKVIRCYGRRPLIKVGIMCMGMSCLGFGSLALISNKATFVAFVFAIRFLQGFSSSCIQTTCYSICTNFYSEQKEQLIGYMEASAGLGMIMGPLIGSILYYFVGFTYTFYLFGAIFLVVSIFISRIFPLKIDMEQILNHGGGDEETNQQSMQISGSGSVVPKREIGYMTLLSNSRFTLAAITSSLGYFLYAFIEPILAYRLLDFSLTQIQIGLFFSILPVFYIGTSIIVQFTPKTIEKRAILILACFAAFVVNIFVGPSQLFGLPNSLLLMGIGQALLGVVDTFLIVPTLPEMIDTVVELYPEDEILINDLSAGIFNSFLGLGQISGPIYGSLMTKYTNFRLTCDYVALLMLVFSLIYFKFGRGYDAFKDSKCKKSLEKWERMNRSTNYLIRTPISIQRPRYGSNASHDYELYQKRHYSLFSPQRNHKIEDATNKSHLIYRNPL